VPPSVSGETAPNSGYSSEIITWLSPNRSSIYMNPSVRNRYARAAFRIQGALVPRRWAIGAADDDVWGHICHLASFISTRGRHSDCRKSRDISWNRELTRLRPRLRAFGAGTPRRAGGTLAAPADPRRHAARARDAVPGARRRPASCVRQARRSSFGAALSRRSKSITRCAAPSRPPRRSRR
jgi:hypothetical protein